jgi:two-component system OmpR family sensor kinase
MHALVGEIMEKTATLPDDQPPDERFYRFSHALHINGDKLLQTSATLPDGGRAMSLYTLITTRHPEAMQLMTAAHDLRTPLTAIIGYAELLEALSSDDHNLAMEGHLKTVACIHERAQQLGGMLNDLLQAARLLDQITPIGVSDFELTESLIQAMHLFYNTNAVLDCPLPYPTILANARRLEQTLRCLCREIALRDPTAACYVGVESVSGSVIIRVMGSPYDVRINELKRLLDARSTGDVFNVNLFLARLLTELQGGTFEYAFEEGITFTLRFPTVTEKLPAN